MNFDYDTIESICDLCPKKFVRTMVIFNYRQHRLSVEARKRGIEQYLFSVGVKLNEEDRELLWKIRCLYREKENFWDTGSSHKCRTYNNLSDEQRKKILKEASQTDHPELDSNQIDLDFKLT